MGLSYVVTGGGQGVGRAIVERLLADAGTVIVLERNPAEWMSAHPAGARLVAVTGDAGDQEASFINGAVLPVDGGRSVLGQDPEQA
jgi:short-subunit dehydrogenase involved in D-alanine esterification of teichoic acids